MGLITLQDILKESVEYRYAVAAFDSTDLYATEAILEAAERENAPVILMIPSIGIVNRKELGWYIEATVSLLRACSVPVCLHLDHSGSVEECLWAIRSGFTGVMFDGSSLPFNENVEKTKIVARAAHAAGVGIEAEIGHVGNGSETDWEKEQFYTKVEDAQNFVELTGVDALAVAVGTVHGLYHGDVSLDLERLRSIRDKVDIPLVLHGGTGLSDKDFVNVIENGINKINIFTGLSVAAGEACRKLGKYAPEGPIHVMEFERVMRKSICETAREHIKLFRSTMRK